MSYSKSPDEAREYITAIENAIMTAESSDADYARIDLSEYTVEATTEFYPEEPNDE